MLIKIFILFHIYMCQFLFSKLIRLHQKFCFQQFQLNNLYFLYSKNLINMQRNFFKIKVVVFFGYNGSKFHGLQFQKEIGVIAIENILLDALLKTQLIRQCNAQKINKIKLSRAARTDKFVHALSNAISLKIDITQKYLKHQHDQKISKKQHKNNVNMEKIICQLNQVLPQDIRIHYIRKVTKRFDVRHDALYRIYTYIMPTNIFLNYQQIINNNTLSQQQSKSIFQDIQQLIKTYIGTHSYHNFSKQMKRDDPKAKRYIIDINVTNEVYQGDSYFRFQVKGQSFIFHQIRKMFGIFVQMEYEKNKYGKLLTLQEKKQFLKNALTQENIKVFLSPGQGLYLKKVCFDVYHKKIIPQSLDPNQLQEQKINQFQHTLQKQHIFTKKQQFKKWILNLYEGAYSQKQQSNQLNNQN